MKGKREGSEERVRQESEILGKEGESAREEEDEGVRVSLAFSAAAAASSHGRTGERKRRGEGGEREWSAAD